MRKLNFWVPLQEPKWDTPVHPSIPCPSIDSLTLPEGLGSQEKQFNSISSDSIRSNQFYMTILFGNLPDSFDFLTDLSSKPWQTSYFMNTYEIKRQQLLWTACLNAIILNVLNGTSLCVLQKRQKVMGETSGMPNQLWNINRIIKIRKEWNVGNIESKRVSLVKQVQNRLTVVQSECKTKLTYHVVESFLNDKKGQPTYRPNVSYLVTYRLLFIYCKEFAQASLSLT